MIKHCDDYQNRFENIFDFNKIYTIILTLIFEMMKIFRKMITILIMNIQFQLTIKRFDKRDI